MNTILCSVFTDDIVNNIDLIDKIKNFFQEQHKVIDFVIFTDNVLYATTNHSILTTFYMAAYNGYIVFTNIYDYLEYKDHIKANPILYLESNDIPSLDRNSIKNCSILTQTGNSLEWIKHYEL